MTGDGRMFGWQRSDLTGLSPVIVWDPLHGCTKNFKIVSVHLMRPEQYTMTLTELAVAYPVPATEE